MEEKALSTIEPKTTLPSVSAAEALWLGHEGAVRDVVLSTLGRAAVISVGLLLAGERRRVVKYSLFSALAIEAMVLTLVRLQLRRAAENLGDSGS